jgi:hypothetical protein
MEDGPGRIVEVAGQTFEMNFEIASLITSGPMENTYLGSVEWGWQSDATGNVTPAVRGARLGRPDCGFMQAAGQWNASTFHDDSFWGSLLGETVDTVDSDHDAAVGRRLQDMTTAEILARVPVVQAEIRGLSAGERRPHQQGVEMRPSSRSSLKLDLECHSISDTGGAASPPEDEVWPALSGGSGGLGRRRSRAPRPTGRATPTPTSSR